MWNTLVINRLDRKTPEDSAIHFLLRLFFDRVKCEILKTERKILNNQPTLFIYKHLSPGKIPFLV